jgi:arylsulfatase A-like enzyme
MSPTASRTRPARGTTRPSALRPALPVLAALALLATLAGTPGCGRDERPNVLLITLDTTRADYLGCYGKEGARTPVLDGLAAEGVLFERAVSPSQCTNPAHASILTGLYPARHGVYDNATSLSEQAVTLAEALRDAGYATLGAVSARHLNDENSRFGQGFETFLDCEPIELAAGERNASLLPALRALAGRPFLAWVHYYDPHGDYSPPPPYDTLHEPGDDFAPIASNKTMDIRAGRKPGTEIDPDAVIALYRGEISYLDMEIGRLLATLAEMGEADNTLVVVIADHGESMMEKDVRFCHAGMYNQVLHVPLLMRWPGHLPAGRRVESLVSSADIHPTVLALLGIGSASPDLSGRDLRRAIRDPRAVIHAAIFSESVEGRIRAVHQGEEKYIKPYPRDWSVTEPHLFRPFADYAEERELRTELPGRVRELDALLEEWLRGAQARCLPPNEDEGLDEKTAEALRALGYIN